jgi:UPF0755 protein
MLILGLILLAGLIAWGRSAYQAPGPLTQAICLKVASGSNMAKVSADLEQQGAITSTWLFRVGADYAGKTDRLKAGSFLVTEGASMAGIVDAITGSGVSTCGTEVLYRVGVRLAEMQVRELDPATDRFVEVAKFDPTAGQPVPEAYAKVRAAKDTRYRISLAEGVTSWQVVEALKAADFLAGKVDELPPEGSLAPDSYEVVPGADRADLLGRMEVAQQARLDQAWKDRAPDLPIATEAEALVLASLIEKETGVAAERDKVASVFVNRLEKGIKLQTDPSVIYGITGGKGVLGRGLRASELKKNTPFNTYLHEGLPPAPITNPGIEAIRAALHPAETDYLYFVADGSGGHVFAATLAEHNENVAKWRAIEAARQAEEPQGGE